MPPWDYDTATGKWTENANTKGNVRFKAVVSLYPSRDLKITGSTPRNSRSWMKRSTAWRRPRRAARAAARLCPSPALISGSASRKVRSQARRARPEQTTKPGDLPAPDP